MLRLLVWGDTAREKEQSQEILRLHAQLVDLQEKLYQTQQKALGDTQQMTAGFMAFLRPTIAQGANQEPAEPSRVLPGDRPSTAPEYPAVPPWTKSEVKTASTGTAVPV